MIRKDGKSEGLYDLGIGDVALALIWSASLALVVINALGPQDLGADTILQTIMSLQKLTLFYWGQNRFVTLVPLLVARIHNPEINLIAVMFIYSASLFALIFLVCWSGCRLFGPLSRGDRWLAVSLLMALTIAIWNERTLFTFTGESQPYSPSYFLATIGAVALIHSRRAAYAIATWLIFLATGLNPSIVLVAVFGALLLYWHGRRRESIVLVLIALVSFGLWAALSSMIGPLHPISYYTYDFDPQQDLMKVFGKLLAAIHLPILLALGCGLAFLAFFLPVKQHSGIFYTLVAFSVAWILIFASNAWVKANDSEVRYFFPVLATIVLLCWLHLFEYVKMLPTIVKKFAVIACIAFPYAVLAAPYTPLSDYPVLKASEPWVRYAITNKIQLIGGDYWSVWPTVFVLLARGETVYGYAARGDSNGESVRALLKPGLKAMCLNAPSTICIAQAKFITGLEWQAGEACGAECGIIELR